MHTKLLMFCFSCYQALELKTYLQYSIGIATEKSFRHIKLTDTKIWISKNVSSCRVLANWVTSCLLNSAAVMQSGDQDLNITCDRACKNQPSEHKKLPSFSVFALS